MARIVWYERWRGDVVAAAPDLRLRFPVLGRDLRFVEALQRAVVPFVEAPAFFDGNPQQVEPVARDPARTNGALQDRGEGDVEREPFGLEKTAGLRRFGATLVGEIDVGPSGEPVFLVPGGLAVAEENEFVHVRPDRGAEAPRYMSDEPDRGAEAPRYMLRTRSRG